MALEFVGEIGVYFPDRDAIRFIAISAGTPIDCYVGRGALAAMGCTAHDGPQRLVEVFQNNRDLIELAALIKMRRSLTHMIFLDIDADDLSKVS